MTNEYYYANPDFVGYLTSGVSVSERCPTAAITNIILRTTF